MRFSAETGEAASREPIGPDILAGHFVEKKGYLVRRTRGAASWLIILTLNGKGKHRTSDHQLDSVPGDLVLWEPGAWQEYSSSNEGWEFLWAHFHLRPHWKPLVDWPLVGSGLHACSCDPKSETWQSMVSHMEEIRHLADGTWLDQLEAKQKLEGLLISILRTMQKKPSVSGNPQIDAALAWALRNLDKPVKVEDLAKVADMSPSGFAHKFKEIMGASPRLYIEQRKMEKARELLALTSLPIKTIAREVGFSSEFHFSHRFSIAHKVSPSHYRQNCS